MPSSFLLLLFFLLCHRKWTENKWQNKFHLRCHRHSRKVVQDAPLSFFFQYWLSSCQIFPGDSYRALSAKKGEEKRVVSLKIHFTRLITDCNWHLVDLTQRTPLLARHSAMHSGLISHQNGSFNIFDRSLKNNWSTNFFVKKEKRGKKFKAVAASKIHQENHSLRVLVLTC